MTRTPVHVRADKNGKKWHAWRGTTGEEHWFARTGGGRMAVGSHTARVTRRDGGITLHGTPEYARSEADQATRQAPVDRAHPGPDPDRDLARRAGRRPAAALDEALAPLLELAAPLRTGAQRDALAAYVIRKLHNAWNTR